MFKRIEESDLAGKGVIGLPDTPNLTAAEMQRKFEETAREVIVPRFNELVDALGDKKAGEEIGIPAQGELKTERIYEQIGELLALLGKKVGSERVKALRVNEDNQLEVSFDGENFQATGSSGHIIMDQSGAALPQRGRLQLLKGTVRDDPAGNVTILEGIPGERGPQGIQGVQGAQGPVGKVYIPDLEESGDISWEAADYDGRRPAKRNIRGPQGVQGVQGIQGPEGKQGPQGVQGLQGEPGRRGEKGESGESFRILDLYPTKEHLEAAQPSPQKGDAYGVGTAEENEVFLWNGVEWKNMGQLQGPQGPEGKQGPQGIQGVQGIQGPEGRQGIQGIQGPEGKQGPAGPAGRDGLTTSVNGIAYHPETGDIVLTAADVGADPEGSAKTVLDALGSHVKNTDIHTTVAEKTKWNGYDTIHTLTHTKSGTVHKLTGMTGLTGMVSCVFKATAAFAAGNTFTVDGTAYTVQLSNGETAEANLFVSGATVPVIIDTAGKKINFKAAGSKVKLPADTAYIFGPYTTNTNFTVPFDGTYRITCIGKGANGKSSTNSSGGGGGGSGAWCRSQLILKKDAVYTITVDNAVSSFGSFLSAGAGQTPSDSVGGTGGTASGGNEKNYNGTAGGNGASYNGGGSGRAPTNYSESPFLYYSPGNGGYADAYNESHLNGQAAGTGSTKFSYKIYNPFGNSGGGSYFKTDSYSYSGGAGSLGAVFVELVT